MFVCVLGIASSGLYAQTFSRSLWYLDEAKCLEVCAETEVHIIDSILYSPSFFEPFRSSFI